MLKKKCFAALSGILLAISIIAPFSFSKVDAAAYSGSQLRVLFSFDTAKGETYVYMDVIYTSDRICSGLADITFKYGNISVSYGLFDGEGVSDITFYVPETGYRTYQIDFNNTSYFVYRFTIRDNDPSNPFWTATALSKPAATSVLNLSFSFDDTPVAVGSQSATINNGLEGITRAKIALYLETLVNSGLTVDTSAIESLLQQIITNQNAGNQQSQDVVNDNDQQISDGIDIVDEYDGLTSTFDSDFVNSQEDIQDIMSDSSLTQFSDAAIWFTQQLASLYNSMGDMKILVTLPLLLGIALFFIGRGNVIFRDPNVEQWSSGTNYTYDENGNSHVTSYTNYRVTERRRTKHGGK